MWRRWGTPQNFFLAFIDELKKNLKNQNFENWKHCWRYHHFTRLPKITIIWRTVPEIRSETGRIFCHFGSFFALLNCLMIPKIQNDNLLYIHEYHKWRSCYSWNIRCDRQKILSFWAIFRPFSPLTTWKNKILKLKKKNTWRYYHFIHLHHKWISYDVWFLRYGVWQNFLSFWIVFCPFTPLWTQKIKILKKWKKHLKILLFYKCVP